MLVADDQGRFGEHPELRLAAGSWDQVRPARELGPLVPLPEGSLLVFLPGRRPIGLDPRSGRPRVVGRGSRGPQAVAAVLPPGYLRLGLPAHTPAAPGAPALPLRAYCAVGLVGDRLVVSARRVDPRRHWDPARFAVGELRPRIVNALRRLPGNRVLAQLAHCALDYGCCTASNVFLGTFEGALPVSPRCNARCLGCISGQPRRYGPSPQRRLSRPPPVQDLVAVAVRHLGRACPGMVSFGQGCEGEPLAEARRVAAAIRGIRAATRRGSIQLNTNGSRPEALPALAKAGLDSIRVSLVSARPEAFRRYHRGTFDLATVEAFIARGVRLGLYVAVNLLVFPGFTDRPGELEALAALFQRTGAQMVQLRNLDLDPERFVAWMQPAEGQPIGLVAFLRQLRRRIPGIDIGCFNRFKEEIRADRRRFS